MRIGWLAVIALAGCQTPNPCPPVVDAAPKLTLLVTDVAPSSKGVFRLTALALNAPENTVVEGKTSGALSQTWTPAANGREVSFLLEGNDTVRARVLDPLMPDAEPSNAITVLDGKIEVERPAPDLVLKTRTEFKMIILLVPGAQPEGVHLFNGRGMPVAIENHECLSSQTRWLKSIVSECWVWFYDPADGVGFRGEHLQAVVDTPSGPMRTRMLKVR